MLIFIFYNKIFKVLKNSLSFDIILIIINLEYFYDRFIKENNVIFTKKINVINSKFITLK